MTPFIDTRARRAAPALGATCLTTFVALPTAAHADATAARVADITPGHTRLNVVLGRVATVTGRANPAIPGRSVALQRRAGDQWVTIARATTRAGGGFRLRFRPQRPASARVRLRVDDSRRVIGRLNVYRHTSVSWYGPGLYGNKLSCGGRLTAATRARLGFGGGGSVLVAH